MITTRVTSSQKNRPEGRLTRFPQLLLLTFEERILVSEELVNPCSGVTQNVSADRQPTRHLFWLT